MDIIKETKGMKYKYSSPNICQDKIDKIKSVWLVKIPYKGRNAVKVDKVVRSIFTLGLVNISESVRQDVEHWGLIFETEYFYYVVQYTDGGIKTKRSKKFDECKKAIYDCSINPYDTWYEKKSFRNSLDLDDVERYTRDLIPSFNENNYNGFTNNCQYFAKALLKKIE